MGLSSVDSFFSVVELPLDFQEMKCLIQFLQRIVSTIARAMFFFCSYKEDGWYFQQSSLHSTSQSQSRANRRSKRATTTVFYCYRLFRRPVSLAHFAEVDDVSYSRRLISTAIRSRRDTRIIWTSKWFVQRSVSHSISSSGTVKFKKRGKYRTCMPMLCTALST